MPLILNSICQIFFIKLGKYRSLDMLMNFHHSVVNLSDWAVAREQLLFLCDIKMYLKRKLDYNEYSKFDLFGSMCTTGQKSGWRRTLTSQSRGFIISSESHLSPRIRDITIKEESQLNIYQFPFTYTTLKIHVTCS